MAVEIFRKRSADSFSQSSESPELVTVGIQLDNGKLTFSGESEEFAVIVSDPPTLILTAPDGVPQTTQFFQVTFVVETSGWELAPDGAFRLLVDNGNAGLQVPRDTDKEVTVLFYNGLKDKQKDLWSFELGVRPVTTFAATAESQTIWHDPTILWEPPRG